MYASRVMEFHMKLLVACSKCKVSNRIKRINRNKHTICIEFQGSNHIIDK